jgi:hypothetical protein
VRNGPGQVAAWTGPPVVGSDAPEPPDFAFGSIRYPAKRAARPRPEERARERGTAKASRRARVSKDEDER